MSFKEFANSQIGRRALEAFAKMPGLLKQIIEQMEETNLWLKRMHNATQVEEDPAPALTPEPPCTCPGYPMEPETPEEMSTDCPIHGDQAT